LFSMGIAFGQTYIEDYEEPASVPGPTVRRMVNSVDFRTMHDADDSGSDYYNSSGWGWTTTPKNQGATPQCVPYATAGAAETDLMFYYNAPTLNYDLSEGSIILNQAFHGDDECCDANPQQYLEQSHVPDTFMMDDRSSYWSTENPLPNLDLDELYKYEPMLLESSAGYSLTLDYPNVLENNGGSNILYLVFNSVVGSSACSGSVDVETPNGGDPSTTLSLPSDRSKIVYILDPASSTLRLSISGAFEAILLSIRLDTYDSGGGNYTTYNIPVWIHEDTTIANHGWSITQSTPNSEVSTYDLGTSTAGDLIDADERTPTTYTDAQFKASGMSYLLDGVSMTATYQTHRMQVVGLGTLKEGDTLYYRDSDTYNQKMYISDDSNWIGWPYVITKNSTGTTSDWWGDGFCRYAGEGTFYTTKGYEHVSSDNPTRNCLDEDGDGYYWWGLYDKPASCSSAPNDYDANDNNAMIGPRCETTLVPTANLDFDEEFDGDTWPSPINPEFYKNSDYNIVSGALKFSTDYTSGFRGTVWFHPNLEEADGLKTQMKLTYKVDGASVNADLYLNDADDYPNTDFDIDDLDATSYTTVFINLKHRVDDNSAYVDYDNQTAVGFKVDHGNLYISDLEYKIMKPGITGVTLAPRGYTQSFTIWSAWDDWDWEVDSPAYITSGGSNYRVYIYFPTAGDYTVRGKYKQDDDWSEFNDHEITIY